MVWAQEAPYNFALNDGDVIWQKVYTSDMTTAQLADFFIASGRFEDLTYNDDNITCRLKPVEADWKKLGYTSLTVPEMAASSDIVCFATIQVKDGRYRVSAEDLYFIANRASGFFKAGEKTAVSTMLLKKGAFRTSSSGAMHLAEILDAHLTESFSTNQKAFLQDDNW